MSFSSENIRFALHGGAGVIDRASLSVEKERQFRAELQRITELARDQLLAGARALDAVEQAIRALEDFPLFNAGLGAVLNAHGAVELDASIMDGRQRACGAIAAGQGCKHPISIARAVMERTEHVLIAGAGVAEFCARIGAEVAPLEYFVTPERLAQQQHAAALGLVTLDHSAIYAVPKTALDPHDKKGTVGAVARDGYGDLAAGTSTGGMTNKMSGRCGDTPIIGAGTWADNQTLAASATGHGEYFIRNVVCYDLHAQMQYAQKTLVQAADATFARIAAMGGEGGLIAIDASGHILLPYNSEGMYRGSFDGQTVRVAIYQD
jgi:L-asparaginase / beta-aspartyl-peptidase